MLFKKNIIFSFIFLLSYSLYGQDNIIDSLQKKLKNTKQDSSKVKVLIDMADAYRHQANFTQALFLSKKAIKMATKSGYSTGKVKGNLYAGIIYDDLGKYTQALNYYYIALKLAKKNKMPLLIGRCYNNIGVTYKNLGDYSKAIEVYQNALKITEEAEDELSMAMVYNNIGIIQADNKEYDKALGYYKKALNINLKNKYKYGLATNYANIGHAYKYQKQYQKMIKYHKQALKIDLSIPDSVGIAADYSDLGIAYVNLGDYIKALEYEQKSLAIREKSKENNKLPENYLQLSKIYLEQNDLEKSKYFALKSLKMAEKTKHLEYKRNAVEQLSKIYEMTQDYKQAYDYHQKFKIIADSLLNEKNTREITLKEAKYNFDKEKQILQSKQKQEKIKLEAQNEALTSQYMLAMAGIILLLLSLVITLRFYSLKRKANIKLQLLNQKVRRINEEIRLQRDDIAHKTKLVESQKQELEVKNNELLEINEEKNFLIGVVAHDLKAPLNQITGLITLISYSKEKLPEEPQKYIDMISDAVERLRAMITNILDVNAIETKQVNLDLENITVEKLLTEIGKDFEVQAEEKYIKIHYPNSSYENIIKADNNYLRQVFENIISNAIKFSPQNKNIFLSVENKQKKVLIKIRDEGPGISNSDKKKLFMKYNKLSAKPTGKEDSTGLGLAIVKKFVEVMNGKIYCESALGKGATFVVEFDS